MLELLGGRAERGGGLGSASWAVVGDVDGVVVRWIWDDEVGEEFRVVEMLRECALRPTWMIHHWPLAVEGIVIDLKNGANWVV